VIQNAGLFPHKTVVDNVATVPKLLGWDKRRTRARRWSLLERVGWIPSWPSGIRPSCPVASSNESASPVPWRPIRPSC
jgi:hypothetical protein